MGQQQTKSFVSIQAPAQWTKGLLFSCAGISCVAIVSGLLQATLLNRMAGGLEFSQSDAAANDARQQIIGIIGVLLYLLTAIAFLVWFHRAHMNLPALGARGLEYTPGWAVGGFFVPFLNLVRPLQVMREVWHGSEPSETLGQGPALGALSPKTPELVGWWWGLFIVSSVLGNVSARLAFNSNPSISDLQTMTWLQILYDITEIPSALVAAQVVATVTARQVRTWGLRSAASQPVPAP